MVPENATGRKARCKACSCKFIVPSLEEMLEQTISHFVLEEIHEREEKLVESIDRLSSESVFGVSVEDPPHRSSKGDPGTVMGLPISESPAEEEAVEHDGFEESGSRLIDPDDSAAVVTVKQPPKPRQPVQDLRFPTELRPSKPRPYLLVKSATLEGVRFAFETNFLNHETFRTSMPIRCVRTGVGPDRGLYCRSMIFVDRFRGDDVQLNRLILKHERKFEPGHSPRDHMRHFGRIENMAPPYENPMLFYIADRAIADPLKCKPGVDCNGLACCEVLVPHYGVAAEWVERVNGRCGPEYAILKAEAAKFDTDAWSKLPLATRSKLGVWCHFKPGEQFKAYINEADLRSVDAGLGGIVITDRRFIYHKYRKTRAVKLDEPSTLHVSMDTESARLALEKDGRLSRTGKIRRNDLGTLISVLNDAEGMQVRLKK